jgi:hypothetical protein
MQVLVKWTALPESLSTWEDLEALKQRFPVALAWGQAISKDWGGDTVTPRVTKSQSTLIRLLILLLI